MSIAIVILNYNGRHYLERFLPGVIAQSGNYPVYIADNNSSDDSIEFLKHNFPLINLIRFEQNYGFAGGYNEALKQIESDYFILLNSDVEVSENWIEPLRALFNNNSDLAACQPKILDYTNRDYFEYAGAAGGYIDPLGYPFCRGRIFTSLEKDFGQYDDESEIFWASGACMMIRSDLFHKAGGFDEEYFAHMEEIDLCWRLKLMGFKIGYSGKSKVFHVGGGTLSSSNPFKTYLNFRNSFQTLIKNIPAYQLIYKIPGRFILDFFAAIKFLFGGSVRDVFAIVRADLFIAGHFFHILSKRKKQLHSNQKLTGMYGKIIVITYYFLHRRHFFNL